MQAVSLKVFGRVQAVGFRYSTKIIADQLGILGFVRNEADGSVSIFAQGPEPELKDFIARIKKAPSPAAHVTQVEITKQTVRDYSGFAVTY
ncbi:acylphosphatase [Liquorilactobacillus satsumensis]|uniref:acylphosphatase n=1 Tax=Liquorilactobacillus satsumensis DSM 16230 = JCM 12392 TaxID=1423801 RepID=A0A0R1UZ24_9LACO|nr:acylphosphatase [Liquorilactobacillus satsumensis]KRL98020.1 hypothetical protein FD50_GL000979 [Liquorilactobacillus satsumensis DSM 16230 = JCM 12392]MCC7667488.1 acylphosphatase [Liquorilactobacillus satsumensis]MCP9312315.1 acylphosphatase [Liquorilactobacillus satsumensis]MCP9327710.1 acylphosphatase [Liquorilactobacillus satsumensis]MCP9357019.1 acylphosphatase [Liquorilactobacillus satsumensis]